MPTFDGIDLVITLDSGVTSIDWIDLYSSWKNWLLESGTNRGYPQAFRTTGGDPLNALLNAGSYWFLRNDLGWRIRPPEENITILAAGNLAPEDADTDMFLPTIGTYTTQILGLQPITQGFSLGLAAGLRYNLFGGGVSLDIINGTPGTVSPIGDLEHPSNNLTDTVAIANAHGFKLIFVRNSMIGNDAIDSGTDIQNFTLRGESEVNTEIEIAPSAICNNVRLEKCNITGTLDGGAHIKDCTIGNLNYVNGHIHSCGLYGTIVLAGNEEAIMADCFTPDQDNPPIIDMGGSGQDLAMPNYSGIVTITNLVSATEEVGIGLDAGIVYLDSTITAGNFIISGVGILQNNSTSVTSINIDGLLNKTLISEAVSDTVVAEIRTDLNPDLISILGLVQENFRLSNQVYDVNHNLLSATMKLFNSAVDCDADINEFATHSIVATYSGSECTSYKVTKD